MEILRFEEAPSDAPKRKKSSRSFLALGLVATLFGVSTAFASSTIQINGPSNLVALGQGVAAVLRCDPDVTITPNADLSLATVAPTATAMPTPEFILSNIQVADVDTRDAALAVDDLGCGGKDFKMQVFHTVIQYSDAVPPVATGKLETAYTCGELNLGTVKQGESPVDKLCSDGAIYFHVTTSTEALAKFTINLDGNSDIDFITLVSTANIDYTP
jgi:hypothetical protein